VTGAACGSNSNTNAPDAAALRQASTMPDLRRSASDRRADSVKMAAIHSVVNGMIQDVKEHPNDWFGDRKHRTRDSFCRGLTRLIRKHIVRTEPALGITRTNAERDRAAMAYASAGGCGTRSGRASIYGPVAFAPAAPALAPPARQDDVDAFIAANWNGEGVTRLAIYGDDMLFGRVGAHDYRAGLSPIDDAVFVEGAAQMESVINNPPVTGGGDDGGDGLPIMSIYFLPPWASAGIGGCIGGVGGQVSDIVQGARLGFAIWGPLGAVGVAAAVTGEACAFGAGAGAADLLLAQVETVRACAGAGRTMKELVIIATCWSMLAELSGASAHVVRITLCSALCVAIREIATRGWRRLRPRWRLGLADTAVAMSSHIGQRWPVSSAASTMLSPKMDAAAMPRAATRPGSSSSES
jgi:hypothetical protein